MRLPYHRLTFALAPVQQYHSVSNAGEQCLLRQDPLGFEAQLTRFPVRLNSLSQRVLRLGAHERVHDACCGVQRCLLARWKVRMRHAGARLL